MSKAQLESNKKVNDLVNSLETITYYKHHYVRKKGLKTAIKKLLSKARKNGYNSGWTVGNRTVNKKYTCRFCQSISSEVENAIHS